MNLNPKFENVLRELNEHKIPYNLVADDKCPIFLEFNHNGLRGLVYNDYVYKEDKRIFCNHSKLFNKMGDCKVKLPLPENNLQMKWLFEILKYVGSKEFYKETERQSFEDYPIGRDLRKMYDDEPIDCEC